MAASVHAAPPTPFSASYAVHSHGTHVGAMERRLEIIEGGKYVFSSETRAAGLVALVRRDRIVETTRGRLAGDTPQPEEYLYEHHGSRKDKTVRVSFDWDEGRIVNVAKGRTWELDAEPETLDKLLYQLVLMQDLADGGREFNYRIADGGQIKDYRFVTVGTERIETPAGTFEAVRLEHEKDNKGRRIDIWCAPSLDYLPVRVDYRERDGDVTSVLLEGSSGVGHSREIAGH